MQKTTRAIVELAMIELFYAKSEITQSRGGDDQVSRAVDHIQRALDTLAAMSPGLGSLNFEIEPPSSLRQH
ncbi:hypothetical protein M2323_004056 [Rhodoblastus acidophilus]|uniref:hypothetical protein n=1 Tax=Rhodoblastus acidophilus TaxID=1074 RepID=UPI002225193D|nr:hypothetical protein [Rhodoblastus acidophilus]MCW2286206.1 hypothetical protein [Rhodoblastus acidophilus]MCW2335112.1 hypothetical protein [Rhodoblastus acidophilus]